MREGGVIRGVWSGRKGGGGVDRKEWFGGGRQCY